MSSLIPNTPSQDPLGWVVTMLVGLIAVIALPVSFLWVTPLLMFSVMAVRTATSPAPRKAMSAGKTSRAILHNSEEEKLYLSIKSALQLLTQEKPCRGVLLPPL